MFSRFEENNFLNNIKKLEIIIEQEEDLKKIKLARIELENIIRTSKLDYIKRKALIILYKGKILKKIKKINFDNLLLEIYDSLENYLDDIYFMEIVIKYYYYEKIYEDSDELETEVFFDEIKDAENKSTLYYYSSLYEFFNLDFLDAINININKLYMIKEQLIFGNKICENRLDIRVFLNLIKFIEKILINDYLGIEKECTEAKLNLKEYLTYSTKENLGLGKDIVLTMESILNIEQKIKNEDIWLDYEEELSNIAYFFDRIYNKQIEKELESSMNLLNNKFIEKMMIKRYEKNLLKLAPKIKYLLSINDNFIYKKIFNDLLNEITIDQKKVEINEWLLIIQKSFNIIQKNNNCNIYNELILKIIEDKTLSKIEKFNKILNIIEENIEIKKGNKTGSFLGDEILSEILNELENKYNINTKKHLTYFSEVISLILKFINSIGKSPKECYKKFYNDYTEDLYESDFQNELYSWLSKSDYASYFDLEKTACADGGRVDIIYSCDELRFPIEIKKTLKKNITKESIEKDYIAQAQTYTYLYNRLGLFILFDISEKDKNYVPNDLRDTVRIHSLKPHLIENNYPNVIVSFVIPAKRILPSKKSTY